MGSTQGRGSVAVPHSVRGGRKWSGYSKWRLKRRGAGAEGREDLYRGMEEVELWGQRCGGRSRGCSGGHSWMLSPEACLESDSSAIKAFDGRGCEESS